MACIRRELAEVRQATVPEARKETRNDRVPCFVKHTDGGETPKGGDAQGETPKGGETKGVEKTKKG